jgi:hypothetical protein
MRDNHVHFAAGKLGRDFADAVDVSLSPPIFDDDALAVVPAEFAESLHECRYQRAGRRGRGRPEETDSPQAARLLRARRERPLHRRAAKRANEFSPSDVDCHVTLSRGSSP